MGAIIYRYEEEGDYTEREREETSYGVKNI